jgi:hypothetical protein
MMMVESVINAGSHLLPSTLMDSHAPNNLAEEPELSCLCASFLSFGTEANMFERSINQGLVGARAGALSSCWHPLMLLTTVALVLSSTSVIPRAARSGTWASWKVQDVRDPILSRGHSHPARTLFFIWLRANLRPAPPSHVGAISSMRQQALWCEFLLYCGLRTLQPSPTPPPCVPPPPTPRSPSLLVTPHRVSETIHHVRHAWCPIAAGASTHDKAADAPAHASCCHCRQPASWILARRHHATSLPCSTLQVSMLCETSACETSAHACGD